MFAEPLSAVIDPATVWASTEGAARTRSRNDNARRTKLAVLAVLRFDTTVLGKPLLAYNAFIALRVDLVKFFELNCSGLTSFLL
jgi:hypothetical protein